MIKVINITYTESCRKYTDLDVSMHLATTVKIQETLQSFSTHKCYLLF